MGDGAFGLTPMLGDPRTAAPPSGLLGSRCAERRSQGPIPRTCPVWSLWDSMVPQTPSGQGGHGKSLRTSSQPAKQTPPRTGVLHTLSRARARAGPILTGERGNGDTGFQEAVSWGERGQRPTLQDQLGVSLHCLDWRQTGENREDKNRHSRGQSRHAPPTQTRGAP